MATLNYEVLKNAGYDGYILEKAPVKILQFGEGNFLRAFVDYWFDVANERTGWNGKAVLVQPIAQGLTKLITDQRPGRPLHSVSERLRERREGQPAPRDLRGGFLRQPLRRS